MKAKFYFKLIALMMLGTVIISLNAEAQPRGNSGKSHNKQEKAYKKVEKRNSKYNASAYQYDDKRNDDHHHNYDYDRYGNGKKTYKRYPGDLHHDQEAYTYNHPRYGTVYRSFNEPPVRLKHAHGYYYFCGGHYYQLYPNVGYVRVEVPRSVVFYEIPSQTVRIRIGDHRYYRYGELVFERYNQGYRLAPPSVMININL